jgi:hypothetical protein
MTFSARCGFWAADPFGSGSALPRSITATDADQFSNNLMMSANMFSYFDHFLQSPARTAS